MNAPTWDFDALFPGGLRGAPFQQALQAVEADVEEHVHHADALPALPDGLDDWAAVLLEHEKLRARWNVVATFALCHAAGNVEDREAARLEQRCRAADQSLLRAQSPLKDGIAQSSAQAFDALSSHAELGDWKAFLQTARAEAPLLLPRGEASLAAELARDGILSWSQFYDRVSGRLRVSFRGEEISSTRAQNLLGSTDAATRTEALAALDAAWSGVQEDCASALTHVVGARQVLDDRRGVGPLADTLHRCRMQQATLDAMMEAARRARPLLERHSELKARLLQEELHGKRRLGWEDQSAPLASRLSSMDWSEACDFVVTHFGQFHEDLAAFARRALDDRWVEAEDRDGKRPGGWCASLSNTGASRIFMTFGGHFRSMTTLAHELGHAYHNWVLRGRPFPRRQVPSTLAETASVMAENIVRDAALEAAPSDEERRALLDARVQAGFAFLLDIPARYAFELRLHELRREGPFDPERLSEEMVACQKDAYGEAVATWYPRFWASKLHFYMGTRAFYNFPYTFGYLFSSLVHERARQEGPAFHARYVDLLERTGWQDAEPLARETLGIDLTDPDAWEAGLAPLRRDAEAFAALVG